VDIRQVALHIVTLYNSQSIFFFHKVDHLANKPVRVFPKLFTILIFLPCSSFLTCNSCLDLRSSSGLYLVINIGKLFLDSLFFFILTVYWYHIIALFIFQGIYLKISTMYHVSYSLTSDLLFCSPCKVSPQQLLVC
jgi:hypothetical protein